MQSYIIVAVSFLCLIEIASALKCYNCTSDVQGCGTTFALSSKDKKAYLIDCSKHFPKAVACSKKVTYQQFNREEIPVVTRGCYNDASSKEPFTPKICYDLNQMEACYCTGDECNGQGQIIPAMFLILSASVISLLVKKFH